MKKLTTEKQTYTLLARRGDPSAFYALFGGHIRNLYALLRSRGRDHRAACGEGAQTVALLYGRFIRSRPGNPQRWFVAGCGLRKFDPGTTNPNVLGADIADYERQVNAALNKAYSGRLERGSDGRGNFRSERPLLPYALGSAAVICLVAFLFFSESVLSVSFGRFGEEYRLSFPKMAERLWELSGLVRSDAAETAYHTKASGAAGVAVPGRLPLEAAPARLAGEGSVGGHE